MEYGVVFAENVTIESLNPHNFAMKNEYIDNLISTAWLLIPKIARQQSGLRIVKGFLSDSYMRQHYRTDNADYILKHAKGLALEVTWDMFTADDATNVGHDIIRECLEPIYVIVDSSRKKICIYRRYLTDKSVLAQLVDGSQRVVKSIPFD
jgi:hypothetical protein